MINQLEHQKHQIGRAVAIQPGNRKWVIPPFIILPGKLYQSGWYQGIPPDWILVVSDNGWTTDELGYAWIQHFNACTQSCIKGIYGLLILNGHGSHATPEFDQFCTTNKIITLYMPAHTLPSLAT
jgi:hypothetical protein